MTLSNAIDRFRALALLLATVLAAGLLVMVVETRPAEAAFPGTPNAIAFVKYGSDAEVFRMGSDGFGQTPLRNAGERDYAPAWSADGKNIAFTSAALDGNRDVWRMDADGQNQVNLTKHAAFDAEPAWFPVDNKVAFTSNRTGNYDVFTMTFDAAGNVITTTQLTKNTATDSEPAVSPDGKKLAFDSTRSGNTDVWRMRADGANPVNVSNDPNWPEYDPDWQPT